MKTNERVLEFIKSHIASVGYAPTLREIRDAVGLNSTETVHGHLVRLEAKGIITRKKGSPRAITISTEMMPQPDDLLAIIMQTTK